MGWAELKIRKYQRGEPASWLERRMLEHANPIHFPLAVAASIGLAYGLWNHKWTWILGSSAVALVGHAYCWTFREEGSHTESMGRETGDRAGALTKTEGSKRQ